MKYATLKWVKPAIDDTLKLTRQSLEQFVENLEDTTSLQEAVLWLHEVHGALLMLETESAILLMTEMQCVMKGLLSGEISDKEAAYDSLMRSLIQLPNYLDHLALGYPDMPVALLPLINKLRHLSGKKAMAANLLFFPDVNLSIPQAKPTPALSDAKFKPLVQKLRLNYQKSLVILIKGADKMAGLKALLSVLGHLQQVSGTLPIAKVWWILSGLVEAIAQKGLPLNATTISLLKQADALLSSLVSRGYKGLYSIPPQKYMHNLLNYAAHAKSNGPRLKLVKQAFFLEYSVPSKKLLQTTLQVFAGPDIELMRVVVNIMREDFVLIEENLDIFMRADSPDVSDLIPLVEIMKTAAYALLLLGMDVQSASLLKQSQIVDAISQEKQEFTLASMLDIANDLLKIMVALDILANRGTHARHRIQQEKGLLETQINDVLKVVVDEAKTELSDIIQAAAMLMDKSEVEEDMLNGIPQNFSKIQGLLAILSQTRASKLLHQFENYMLKNIIETQKAPAEQHRKALAEALISIEFYLDTLAGNPMDGNQILHITQQCLKVLYTPVKTA